jgi:hypothetical protein
VKGSEARDHGDLQTEAIEEHRSRNCSYSGTVDLAHSVEDLEVAADMTGNVRKVQGMSRKAAKQTCEAVRESPCMAETRS